VSVSVSVGVGLGVGVGVGFVRIQNIKHTRVQVQVHNSCNFHRSPYTLACCKKGAP
jgi:hypothetical protein